MKKALYFKDTHTASARTSQRHSKDVSKTDVSRGDCGRRIRWTPKVSNWLDLEFWKSQYYCKRTDQIVRKGSLGKIYRADGMFESGRS
jgi:hypothetical protein